MYLASDMSSLDLTLLKLLERRVEFIKMVLERDVRMYFDEKRLLACLRNPKEDLDYSFVNEMFL